MLEIADFFLCFALQKCLKTITLFLTNYFYLKEQLNLFVSAPGS